MKQIERLKQEVQLLSSIGSSTQQAEVNDVVRQLREKHAAEYVSWRKVVAELEGELRTYKVTHIIYCVYFVNYCSLRLVGCFVVGLYHAKIYPPYTLPLNCV